MDIDQEKCHQCKNILNSIHDIYQHYNYLDHDKSYMIYFCTLICWEKFLNIQKTR